MSKVCSYDIIFWGVTGYQGRLSAKYMISKYGLPATLADTDAEKKKVRYAFAGRNSAKLYELRKSLAEEMGNEEIINIPIIIANSDDFESLRLLCSTTKVVISYVGPYVKLGENLVKACVESMTHYVDTTGEAPFVRKIFEKYGPEAKEKKLKIVPHSAFDCVPSDVTTWLLQEHAISTYGKPCQAVRLRLTELKLASFSGGTTDTLFSGSLEVPGIESPYFVCAGVDEDAPKEPFPKPKSGSYEKDVGYVSSFMMGPINTRCVCWTNHLLNYRYGKDFVYNEALATFSSAHSARMYSLSKKSQIAVAKIPGISSLVRSMLPRSGEGATKEELDSGRLTAKAIGEVTDAEGNSKSISYSFKIPEDPGYAGTAKMSCEAALCCVWDLEKCPDVYGVLSPVVALGTAYVERLRNINYTIELDS